jgi:hypothetical protein
MDPFDPRADHKLLAFFFRRSGEKRKDENNKSKAGTSACLSEKPNGSFGSVFSRASE